MPASRKVVWTELAARDLEDIVRYIARDSPKQARIVAKRIYDRVETLSTLPNRGRVVPELLDLGLQDWRELVVPPYRLVYRTTEHRVIIQLIFDSRRDAASVLEARLLR